MSTQPVQKDFWSLCAESSLNVLPDEFNPSGTWRGIMVRAAAGVSSAHRVKYVEWEGKGEKGTLICVHGVFRNSRDFDVIAQHLADRGWRVVCPDLPGRGSSDKLPNPAFYAPPQYALDCVALLARLDVERVSWLGTSLGGLIGLTLAAVADSPIERLILNDVGTEPLPKDARDHIKTYAAEDRSFDTVEELEAYLRRIYAAFGELTDAQWRHLAEHSQCSKADGKLGVAYDVELGRQVIRDMAAFDNDAVRDAVRKALEASWQQVHCPALVLNGTESLVLSAGTAAMAEKDGVTLKRFAGCGHAPALMNDEQIGVVRDWLERT